MWQKLTFWLRIGWKNVTIEPVVFLYLISVGLTYVIRPNLLLDKACRIKLNLTEDICQNLTSHNESLAQVQKVVADYEGTLNLAASVPRIAFTLLAGPWSDRHGRKMLIMAPICGQAITAATFLINVRFFNSLPFEALYLEYVNELSGNFVVYYLGEYSYMADITSPDERTARLGVLDGTDYISTMIGTYVSGPLFANFGYYTVFGASCAAAILGLIYMAFIVKESRTKSQEKRHQDPRAEETQYGTQEVIVEDVSASKYCNWSDVTACFHTVFKKRPHYRRLYIWLLLFNFGCYIFAYNGTEGTHRYLFTNYTYGWSEQEYTQFLAAYKICYLIALWILLPFCSRWLKFHDATTLILACLTGAFGWLLPVFIAGQELTFIIGFIIASFTPVCTIGVRALISRCVGPDEIGSIFALISVISAISSSLITAAYQAIYATTLDSFPAAFLVINAAFLLLTVPNNLLLRRKMRTE